jgi:uncharacterized protein (TIGR03083 family)
VTTSPTDRKPARLRHADWMAAAEEEYSRLLSMLADLSPEDWRRPTDCTEWDVRAMVAHLVGAAESNASLREAVRQLRQGRQHTSPGCPDIDGINALQIHERRDAAPTDLLAALAAAAPRAVRGRRRIPAPVRAVRVPFGPPLGVRSVGYLMDRIYTRDAWMHRIDIARTTGTPLVLTADHDGRLVADLVDEWARAHRQPFVLELTGPAGGRHERGTGGERLELDAVEFARTLAGRAPGTGLLATTVPF